MPGIAPHETGRIVKTLVVVDLEWSLSHGLVIVEYANAREDW